eukprot:CAMPEP_0116896260 /NCGR_PEP_ID=MMETSP0467-20121206/5550_1 /TAXON_ID=283647 /ORGANISM="Mesodinium pulex, Strain SPMC105" /LENGTH=96 /DNA_ID=CAMNT_0004567345 /DNA_START=648 /DNA_END=938 /DNA_ORIENTATION=+
MYVTPELARERLGVEGPGIKYNPNIESIKNHNYVATIGNSKKVDFKVLNPLTGRSPGPMYNCQSDFILKHNSKFGTEERLKEQRKENPTSGNYNVS